MKTRKTIEWALIFSVLLMFTVYAVGNATGYGRRVALAKTIEAEPELSSAGTLIVAADDERELRRLEREARRAEREAAQEERRFARFLDRFERYFERDRICVLSDTQRQAIELLYDTSVETLPLTSGDVDVLTVENELLRRSDLRRIIETSGDQEIHCWPLEYNDIFYVLFSGGVS